VFFIGGAYFKIKQGQRYITSGGFATMGYSIPAAIGAYQALKRRTICITGEGSFQQNIQELQTILHYKMPIKIFVINNGGYLSIRLTQKKYFKRYLGESPKTGVSFPSTEKIAKAYGIDYTTNIHNAITHKRCVICEVKCPKDKL